MSHKARSTADSARVKMPPGPEPPAASRSLAAMASTGMGSSPTTICARASTALRSAGVNGLALRAGIKVRPIPSMPSSVSSSRVTKALVAFPGGIPTTRGLSAGVRKSRVLARVTFMALVLSAPWGALRPPSSGEPRTSLRTALFGWRFLAHSTTHRHKPAFTPPARM